MDQMKRAKRDIHTYILTYIPSDYPSHGISYKLTKKSRYCEDEILTLTA